MSDLAFVLVLLGIAVVPVAVGRPRMDVVALMMMATAVMTIFVPVVLRIARNGGIAPGRLMMPLSLAGLARASSSCSSPRCPSGQIGSPLARRCN